MHRIAALSLPMWDTSFIKGLSVLGGLLDVYISFKSLFSANY